MSPRIRENKKNADDDRLILNEITKNFITMPKESSQSTLLSKKTDIYQKNTIPYKGSACLWLEETKCLFLRCHLLPVTGIEELVKVIFGYEPYTDNAVDIIKHTKKVFGDF
ncbi:hypothetical protein C1645_736819 [Glomus cerebriforme]|uniref:Uncharacterized protein n=1 Tax=Glomus cerebriforme TaxID=658196 RepID=A0A397T0L7_9GLOM|nr:hypothetical protein C1645_736819 [Glomus cerebriforme]